MSRLPKHLQPRSRYLAVAIEAWPDADLDRRAFQAAIWDATRSLLGDVGSARADPRLFRFDFADGDGEAVIRVRRDREAEVRAALACITRIAGHAVGLYVRGVSGTVRSCEENYLGERREPVSERTVVFGNEDRTAVVRGDRLDVRTDEAFAGATALDFE